MTEFTSLTELELGTAGIVEELRLPDEVQHHLMHMGFVPEARVIAVRKAPTGDPTVYAIDGFEIALRRETAQSILVTVTEQPSAARSTAGMRGRRAWGRGLFRAAEAAR
jgi:ferrous iron transport protein A